MSIKKFRSLLTTLVLILFLFNYEHNEQETTNRVVLDHSFLNLRRSSFRKLLSCFGCCKGKCKKKKSKKKGLSLPPPPARSCLKKTGQDSQSPEGDQNVRKKRVTFKLDDQSFSRIKTTAGGLPSSSSLSLRVMLGLERPDNTKDEDNEEFETKF
ncbi:hypothetical protein ChUKH1_15560 [Cryptosporidium hominis]|nr:hypothetical protein ChTU502y2012_398g0040 [Cryptosporidium hominis]PPA65123.1 hypothetical protein ChUKH1_15560 [Cryptosporidium hominis]